MLSDQKHSRSYFERFTGMLNKGVFERKRRNRQEKPRQYVQLVNMKRKPVDCSLQNELHTKLAQELREANGE